MLKARPSTKSVNTSTLPSDLLLAQQALQTALDDFQKLLTPEQKIKAQNHPINSNADAVIKFTIELDEENAKRKRRSVAVRIHSLLESVQQFSSIVDTFVSSSEIGSAIWGSIKVTFLVAVNISSYFEKLSEFVMSLRSDCPRFELYRDLFPHSDRLKISLLKYYTTMVNFCAKVIEVGQRNVMKQFSLASWRPFDREFSPFKTSLGFQCRDVDAEIRLAASEAAVRAQRLQKDEQSLMSQFRRKMDLMSQEEHLWRLQLIEQESRNRKEKLLRKLANHSYQETWSRARKLRWAQSGAWLLDSTEFKKWQSNNEHPVLWCSGELGYGKTVLSATVINALVQNASTPAEKVLYFLCDFGKPESMTARVILGCLVQQILSAESMSDDTESLVVKIIREGSLEAVQDLGVVLRRLAAQQPCSIVLDGVDELSKEERLSLFENLEDMNPVQNSYKLFISSRPELSAEMRSHFPTHLKISINPRNTGVDIEEFVSGVLQEKMDKKQLEIQDPTVLAEIKSALTQGANGMFLWVRLQINDICDTSSDYEIRQTLRTLPTTIHKTYMRALNRICQSTQSKVFEKEVRWIAVARRPMTLHELREAIAIETNQDWRQLDRYITDENRLISSCAGLVTLDEEDGTIRFVHHSVQEFLTQPITDSTVHKFCVDTRKENLMVGEACVTYLHFNDFKRQLVKSSTIPELDGSSIIAASLAAGFNTTISESWMRLAQVFKARSESASKRGVVHQLRDNAGFADLRSFWKLQNDYPFLVYASEFWLLHCADFSLSKNLVVWKKWWALFNFEDSNAQLPWTQRELSAGDSWLKWILEHKHYALLHSIMLFLSYSYSRDPETPDSMADISSGGKCNLFKMLNDPRDAVKKSLDDYMLKGAQEGNVETLRFLLHAHLDLNQWTIPCHVDGGLTMLQIAAKTGGLTFALILRNHGADVNARPCKQTDTALVGAIRSRNTEFAMWLIDAGADVNATSDGIGETAVEVAAGQYDTRLVKRLLAAGADVNTHRTIHGKSAWVDRGTALQRAARWEDSELVKVLLAAGADVLADGNRGTALEIARDCNNLEVVALLEEAIATGNSKSVLERTSFEGLSEQWHHLALPFVSSTAPV